MISFSEALIIIQQNCRRQMPVETVPLVLALGRVLADDIVSATDVPQWANSQMDGYAVRSSDVGSASVESPVLLSVLGESSGGHPFTGAVAVRSAVRIMTGAIMPEGADAVVEIEATSEADGIVSVRRAVRTGEYVRLAGEDMRSGARAIARGKRITSGDIAVLAALGITNVPVRVKPKIALLSTGNELVDPGKTPAHGQIRNSSASALFAMCVEHGAEPIDIGIASDDADDLRDKLEQGLRFDILITTGGVSVGRYDLVKDILPDMDVQIQFHRVNIKPGMPVLFGTLGEGDTQTLVFGLPGNPVSSMVTFSQFVTPATRLMTVSSDTPQRMKAILDADIKKSDGKYHFHRGVMSTGSDGSLHVQSTGNQSSGAISSMSAANCLIHLDENARDHHTGDEVTIELLS